MNYDKPSGPIILVPTTSEGSRQLPRLREAFAALSSIDESTPFTCSRKNKEGNQRIRWKDAGITITGIVLPGCIHLTILEIEHRSDAGALKIKPWRFHHSTLNHERPADGVAEFLKDHAPLSCEAASLLSEASPSTTLANLVSSALSCHKDSEFEKRAAAHRNNGAPAYFNLDTDPIFCRISGNPHDIEDNLVPKTILDLPLFARCSYTPGDDITVPVYDFRKDLRIEWQAIDPIASLANLSTLDKLHALLKADIA